jgi:hypothetical protein
MSDLSLLKSIIQDGLDVLNVFFNMEKNQKMTIGYEITDKRFTVFKNSPDNNTTIIYSREFTGDPVRILRMILSEAFGILIHNEMKNK